MNLSELIILARSTRDWAPLIDLLPYARFLNLRLDIKGDQFTACMPFDRKLIGNPALPAPHGGATGRFIECAGLLYLLCHMESADLPKTINFNFEYLRSGRPEDTYANVYMVKQGQRVAELRVGARQPGPDKPIAIGHGNFMLKPLPAATSEP